MVKGIFASAKLHFEEQIKLLQEDEKKMREYANTAHHQLSIHLLDSGLQNDVEMKAGLTSMKDTLNKAQEKWDAFEVVIKKIEEGQREMRKMTPYEKAKVQFNKHRASLGPLIDQQSSYEEKIKQREAGTCSWILDLDEYKEWRDGPKSGLLWVSGGPGFGKSILMSTVVEHLKSRVSGPDQMQYFFCKTGDDSTQLTARITQSLVHQLYAPSENSPDLLEKANEVITKAFNEKGPSSDKGASKGLDFKAAYESLARAYNGTVFLVMDALDECTDRNSHKFLRTLREMAGVTDIRLKILVFSRPEPDISDDLEGLPNVKVEGQNEEDLRKHVMSELERIPGWTKLERDVACEEVVRKASGQFRYIDGAMQFLRQPWQRPIQNRLEGLPAGLANSYLQSLQQTDPAYVGLLKTTLMWTILAEGEIRVPEVMDAYSRPYDNEENPGELLDASSAAEVNLHDHQIRTAGGIFLEVLPKSRAIKVAA